MTNLTFEVKDHEVEIGQIDKKNRLSIQHKDRYGNMLVLGDVGQGKAVFIVNLLVSDLLAGRGGIIIDPYGDLIRNVVDYLPPERLENIAVYEVNPEGAEASLEEFESEFALDAIAEDSSKCIMCKLDFATVGAQTAGEIGTRILELFYETLRNKSDMGQRFLFIDEVSVFLNSDIVELFASNRQNQLAGILADQTLRFMSKQSVQDLMFQIDDLICFRIDSRTARYVTEYGGLDKTVDDLRGLKQFEFWAGLSQRGELQEAVKAQTIWPLPFDQVS